MRRYEQELEKRAAVFRTSASFWEDGVHEWETNDVRSRATYTEEWKEPQWQRQASWFAHAMRCIVALKPESTGITRKKRWFHSNGLREAPHHTAWHSLQHASIWYEVRRWPTTTVRATVPCREGLRPGAALLRLWYRQLGSGSERNMRLDMAVFAWGHMLHEQDASAQLVPSCNARKGE